MISLTVCHSRNEIYRKDFFPRNLFLVLNCCYFLTFLGTKYFMINGELFINSVSNVDGFSGHSYKCNVRNRITGEMHLSATAGKLIVTGIQLKHIVLHKNLIF